MSSHHYPVISSPLEMKIILANGVYRMDLDAALRPRVYPPQGCTDTCSHAGHGEDCACTAPDFGLSVEDRWDHATSKNAGVPEVGPEFRRRWKQVTVPKLKIWLRLIIYMSVVGLTELMNIGPRMSCGENIGL